MTQRRYEYAPPNTLLGLLQRGRGQGALMAAEDRASVADLVHGCIRWEWRWDSQVDDRHLYLARLIRDLELPLAPVVELLSDDEDTRDRAVGVLELLALGGSTEAREALRDQVAKEEHEEFPASQRQPGEPDPMAGLPNTALLELLADPDESAHRKRNALRVLYRREPEPALVPLVPSLGTADGEYSLPLLPGVIRKLGALAMPAAREWVASDTRWLAWEGLSVLAEHGEEQDIPTLIAELERDWVDRIWCGPVQMARGLARFGPKAADAISLLRRFWLHTPHSYERPDYLTALDALGSSGMAEAYTESLWDCEARARLLGVERAPDRPHVRDRLACLGDDPMEDPEVRNAARARLAGLT
ncbi:hypothetical protein [Kitasatospora xanthocidica]|uniref:hypothetical protein n=1 Tax=Kitasatospora xanthocidica TaxID=83382 RepID=UPI00167A91E0|nr:hypothetical protein [Kitasatospora xanthocidica]